MVVFSRYCVDRSPNGMYYVTNRDTTRKVACEHSVLILYSSLALIRHLYLTLVKYL